MQNRFVRLYKLTAFISSSAIILACNQGAKTASSADTAKADTTVASAAKTAPAATGHLIGAWHDEAIKSDKGEQIAYELVSNGDKYYIQAITFVGNDLKLNDTPPISASASEIKKDGNTYTSVERPGEVYKLDKNGDLGIYDNGELVATCKKLI